jgi:hypothetical protein
MNAAARSPTAVIQSTLRVLSARETHELSGKAGVAREMLMAAADNREALPTRAADRVVGVLCPRERRRPRLARSR